jgi:hypothetical protein
MNFVFSRLQQVWRGLILWVTVIIVIVITTTIIIVFIMTELMYNKMIRNADMRLLFFWDVTQRILKGRAVREDLLWTASPLKVGPIVCSEPTLNIYKRQLHNIPEVRRP